MIGSLAVLQMANSACGNVKGYKEILNIFNNRVVIFPRCIFVAQFSHVVATVVSRALDGI